MSWTPRGSVAQSIDPRQRRGPPHEVCEALEIEMNAARHPDAESREISEILARQLG